MKTAAMAVVLALVGAGCAEAEEFDVRDPIGRDAAGPGAVTVGTGVAGASSTVGPSTTGDGSSSSVTTAGSGGASSTGSGGASSTGSTSTTGSGAGTGGASGSGSGSGGSGGAAPFDAGTDTGRGGASVDAGIDRGPPQPTNGFSVLYKCVGTNPMANAIQAEVTINDVGPSTVPLSELTVRYYFTNEIVGTPLIDIGFSGLNPGFHDLKSAETTQVGMVSNPTFTADSYVEFSFTSGAGSIAPNQSVIIAWQYHGQNFPSLNQSNDYSFDSTKTSAVAWERVVLLRSGNVIWGTPP